MAKQHWANLISEIAGFSISYDKIELFKMAIQHWPNLINFQLNIVLKVPMHPTHHLYILCWNQFYFYSDVLTCQFFPLHSLYPICIQEDCYAMYCISINNGLFCIHYATFCLNTALGCNRSLWDWSYMGQVLRLILHETSLGSKPYPFFFFWN